MIKVLDSKTIDKIAAGEVVERPGSIVKELLENALDAGANAVSVEIKKGGTELIRVTDNGSGIPRSEVRKAFLPHATSKLNTIEDLLSLTSLGFRGEALSSIAAVSRVELLTKEKNDPLGTRYVIEGGTEVSFEEAGIPDGTTLIIRDLFYNTPARKKFLKSPSTEGAHISSLMEEFAMVRPDISFKFSMNNDLRLVTTGSGDCKDVIYRIYGKDISESLLPVSASDKGMTLEGFIAKPYASRSSRALENYFVNGRYIRNEVISGAIEDGYTGLLMQHRFPFTCLKLTVSSEDVDVNVHPRKMEVKFSDGPSVYSFIRDAVKETLSGKEFINDVTLEKEESVKEEPLPSSAAPEPFEIKTPATVTVVREEPTYDTYEDSGLEATEIEETSYDTVTVPQEETIPDPENSDFSEDITGKQQDLFEEKILSRDALSDYRLIGQIFNTYLIIEYHDEMLLIDQHAAHEKVNFERFMKAFKERNVMTQNLNPPMILTLDGEHRDILERFLDRFTEMGFEIEPFGGNDFAVRTVPYNLYGLSDKDVLNALLDELNDGKEDTDISIIYDKIASMSCKSAVKGGNKISPEEAEVLIRELMSLKDPYTCPHGRPTVIKMSRQELEKQFGRIV